MSLEKFLITCVTCAKQAEPGFFVWYHGRDRDGLCRECRDRRDERESRK